MIELLRYCLKGILTAKLARNKAQVYQKAVSSDHFIGLNLDFVSQKEWEKILLDAEELCRGYYQIYNYHRFIFKDWMQDPVSGYRMKKAINAAFIKVSSLTGSVDVKNYWELGHLHPVLTLAEAYWHTNDEKYAKKAVEIIESFIKTNPCGKTIHWKCCMDAAIRAANLCHTAFLMRKSHYFLSKQSAIAVSLAEHMIFISENYENTGNFPNNHYLTDLTGVIVTGVFLNKNYPPCEDIQKRLKEAVKRLSVELERQIYPDGMDYENSSYYHCFVTELISASLQTLKENNVQFPESIQKICDRMLGQSEWLGAFDQRLPLFGDQDGSRLYLTNGFFDVDRCDFSYLSKMNEYEIIQNNNTTESGIVKLQNKDLSVYLKCGGIGTGGKGTHDHNDQLSLTVFYRGKPIVIDSGTFLYTKSPADRRKYRSTKAHSTLFIDDLEQNNIDSGSFCIKDGQSGKIIDYNAGSFSGEFTYESGLTHCRTLTINENELVVVDRLSDSQIPAHIQFVIPENVKISKIEPRKVCCNETSSAIAIEFVFDTAVTVEETTYSPAYGVEIAGHKIITRSVGETSKTKMFFSGNITNEKGCYEQKNINN